MSVWPFHVPVIMLLLALLPAMGGCEKSESSRKWTEEDRNAATYYFKSQRDNREASRISQHAGEVLSIGEREKLRNLTLSSLASAKMVPDSFLDKANPHFKDHYRKEFQRALELALVNLDNPNYEAARRASDLFSAYADWFKANQEEIDLPDVEK